MTPWPNPLGLRGAEETEPFPVSSEKMAKNYQETQICLFAHRGDNFYRVQVGAYQDLFVAQQELERLRRQGFGDAFVVAMEGK